MGWRQRAGARIGHELSLTPGQRRVIGVLVAGAILAGVWQLLRNPATIDDPQPSQGDRYAELADRIDPNTAELSDLATLPGLGQKRASVLVDWRTAAQKRDGRVDVFRRAEDLYKVKGIGPGLVNQMRPYLIFPTTRPATPPTP
jgi:hypothetical protein